MFSLIAVVFGSEAIYRGAVVAAWRWVLEQPAAALVNVAILGLAMLALKLLFPSRISLAVASSIALGFTLANRAKLQFLGQPVYGNDLLLYHQYFQVARILSARLAVVGAILLLGLSAAAFVFSWRGMHWRRFASQWGAAAFGIACLLVLLRSSFGAQDTYASRAFDGLGLEDLKWDQQENFLRNGELLTLVFDVNSIFDHPRISYEKEDLERAFARFDGPLPPLNTRLPPDKVILVMNETFWDPTPFQPHKDPLAPVRSNFVARALVPVFGGYTSNSEFELLTGFSMRNLPPGAIPFQEYLVGPLPGLPNAFRDAGYQATAITATDRGLWNADKAYPFLGFQHLISEESFSESDYKFGYISDRSVMQHVEALADAPGKQFVYAMTMQNHGPYEEDRCTGSEGADADPGVKGLSNASRLAVRSYTCGARDAGAMFAGLVAHFRERGDRAVVVMLGDHLPFLGAGKAAYVEAGLLKSDVSEQWTGDQWRMLFTTPIFYWSSDGRQLGAEGTIGLPFLYTAIKQAAGLPVTEFDRCLLALKHQVRGFNPYFVLDAGGRVLLDKDALGELSPALTAYDLIQYDMLFGAHLGEKRFAAAAASF